MLEELFGLKGETAVVTGAGRGIGEVSPRYLPVLAPMLFVQHAARMKLSGLLAKFGNPGVVQLLAPQTSLMKMLFVN